MGYAIAKMAMLRGAEVTLVSGPTAIEPPLFVKVIPVTSARDMFEAVTGLSHEQELFAGKVFLEGGFLQDIFQKGFRLRHFSGSGVPACQIADRKSVV